jgi:hypothetical protein
LRVEVRTRRKVGACNDPELTTSGVADEVTVTESKVVFVLFFAVRSVDELKDLVALYVNRLNEDQLVVRPLLSVRMRGSVFRKLGAVAVPYLAEQDITDKRCREQLAILSVRGLGELGDGHKD